MKKYRVSRLKQLIFPQELLIDKYHVLSRKRHFPAFWLVTEESIPLSKLASIQIHRGMFFSKLIIENSGGPFPIVVNGLWNRQATEARNILEMIEREMQKMEDVGHLIGDDDAGGKDDTPEGPGPKPPRGRKEAELRGPAKENRDKDAPREHQRNPASVYDIDLTERRLPSDEPFREEQVGRSPARAQADPTWRLAGTKPVNPSGNGRRPKTQDESKRRIGEIPENWNPAPPWAPAKEPETVYVEQPSIPEVDPVEFLTREHVSAATMVEEKGEIKRQSPITKLLDWWKQTKSELASAAPQPKRKKRKLN